ncbi:MAG: pilin [Gammaproteobacteria bacterium]|nr:pilin [Gammaproteobacteria bacterium]
MKKYQYHKQGGFTFVELMMVAVIIGILAAISLPAYNSYKNRAKAVEALKLSSTARNQIADFYRQTGGLPADNTVAGLPQPDKLVGSYVQSVTIKNGVIVVKFRDSDYALNDKVLSLHPRITIGSPTTPIAFQCGTDSSSLPKGVVVVGKDETTLSEDYFPKSCR